MNFAFIDFQPQKKIGSNPLFNTGQSFSVYLLQCFLPQSTGHGGKMLSHLSDLPAITGITENYTQN